MRSPEQIETKVRSGKRLWSCCKQELRLRLFCSISADGGQEGGGAQKNGEKHAGLKEEAGGREDQATPGGEEQGEGGGESRQRAGPAADRHGNRLLVCLEEKGMKAGFYREI